MQQMMCCFNCVAVSLMTQWVFNRGVEEQMKAFLDGFSEVLPLQWLQYFDERELEVRSYMLLMVNDEADIIASVIIKAVNSSRPKLDKIGGNLQLKCKIRGVFAVAIVAIQTHQIQVSGVKVKRYFSFQ